MNIELFCRKNNQEIFKHFQPSFSHLCLLLFLPLCSGITFASSLEIELLDPDGFADTVFNPLLQPGGLLSSTVGSILGTDPGRGIGLMFILSGILVIGISSIVWKSKPIRKLE